MKIAKFEKLSKPITPINKEKNLLPPNSSFEKGRKLTGKISPKILKKGQHLFLKMVNSKEKNFRLSFTRHTDLKLKKKKKKNLKR